MSAFYPENKSRNMVEPIKNDLLNAKRACGVHKVEYALQVHSREVVVVTIYI